MDFLSAFNHLLNFLAPALVLGFAMASVAPLLRRRWRSSRTWWMQGAINSVAGVTALVAGLFFFGNDGKMASYAALVALVATSQWLGSGGSKR